MEARVELVRSGDRNRTSCTQHERTCVGAANALTNWASQTDRSGSVGWLMRRQVSSRRPMRNGWQLHGDWCGNSVRATIVRHRAWCDMKIIECLRSRRCKGVTMRWKLNAIKGQCIFNEQRIRLEIYDGGWRKRRLLQSPNVTHFIRWYRKQLPVITLTGVVWSDSRARLCS